LSNFIIELGLQRIVDKERFFNTCESVSEFDGALKIGRNITYSKKFTPLFIDCFSQFINCEDSRILGLPINTIYKEVDVGQVFIELTFKLIGICIVLLLIELAAILMTNQVLLGKLGYHYLLWVRWHIAFKEIWVHKLMR